MSLPIRGSLPSDHGTGTRYTRPAGAIVFDCSGFVVAAFRQIGIDLFELGLHGSQSFPGSAHLYVVADRSQIQPGDLLVCAPGASGIGHIVMYLDGDTYIDAAYPEGVAIRTGIQWSRVTAMVRVPVDQAIAAAPTTDPNESMDRSTQPRVPPGTPAGG
jgi:cell wall-associated NlpC family hydrolase